MQNFIKNMEATNFITSRMFWKTSSVLLIALLWVGVINVGGTRSYYNDTESSTGNSFTTGALDFTLTGGDVAKIIGPEALGAIAHAVVVAPEKGSVPMQYVVDTTVDAGTSNLDFCNALTLEAKLNGVVKYDGAFSAFSNPVTSEFGSWEFRFVLPPDASVLNNVQCNAKVLISAWRADTVNKTDSGWSDEESVNISLTSRMVVLNEIYARPNGGLAPKDKEYIELYNNSSAPVDVLGWQISEVSGTSDVFYSIVASDAVAGEMMPYDGASTIIPSGGYLVLQFSGSASRLNDSGDTVKLYDASTLLLDAHTYSAISAGKAVVRFPDGVGYWVDPEGTPGSTNMVSLEDLRAAGFDDATINAILELVGLKKATLLETVDMPAPVEASAPQQASGVEEADVVGDDEAATDEPVAEEEENTPESDEVDVPPAVEPEDTASDVPVESTETTTSEPAPAEPAPEATQAPEEEVAVEPEVVPVPEESAPEVVEAEVAATEPASEPVPEEVVATEPEVVVVEPVAVEA